MSDLRDLYQEVILDHSKAPRQFGELDGANCTADGYNPLCGDKIKVFVRVEDGRVEDVTFEGTGCAISTASASMMAQALRGKTTAEIEETFREFHDLVTGKVEFDAGSERLGKLAIFAGVSKFPVRVKCATLCWHTLRAALEHRDEPVSTE